MAGTLQFSVDVPKSSVPPGRIRVSLGDVSRVDGRTDPGVFVRVWSEAARLLREAPTVVTHPWGDGTAAEYRISVDASDVLAHLESATEESLDSGATHERWRQRAADGRHPFGAYLDLQVSAHGASGPGVAVQALSRFLQHLFLAMNIAVPGSFSLYLSRYEGLGWVEPDAPQHTASQFESAAGWARRQGWPTLSELPFDVVWRWLGSEVLHLNLATEPWQKALFTFWRVSDESAPDPERLHAVAQALEAMLGQPGVSARQALASGVARVLGDGEATRRWLPGFYGVRSAFAHGILPLLRPGGVFDLERYPEADTFDMRYWEDLDAALAVLVGVVQSLVQSGTRTV